MALFEAVVERNLFEVNLAGLPECLLTLLLLGREELGDVRVVTLRDVLVPALLHLVILHVINILDLQHKLLTTDHLPAAHLGDAPRSVWAWRRVGKIHNPGEVWVLRVLDRGEGEVRVRDGGDGGERESGEEESSLR